MLGRALDGASVALFESEEALAEERRVRSDLGRFLPREVVEDVVTRSAPLALGGKRVPVTTLFADVVAFTPLCEAHDPEVVVALLNELFTIVTEIVFRHGGVVDKFMGDCVMAFWGAPREDPEHAARALEAAADIMSWLEFGNEHWSKTYGVELELAVGVHTGEAIVGNVGSESRMEYTVIGRSVNTAARLEALARPGQILTSGETAALAPHFHVRSVGDKDLGPSGHVELFEVDY